MYKQVEVFRKEGFSCAECVFDNDSKGCIEHDCDDLTEDTYIIWVDVEQD